MRYDNILLLGGDKENLRASIRCRKLDSVRRRIKNPPQQ